MRSRADARVPVLFVRLGASVGVSRPAGVRAAPMIRVRCWRRRKGGCVRRAPFGFACSQSLSPRATSGWALERGWRHAEKLTTDTLRSVLRQAIETFPLPHPPKSGDPVRDVDDGEGELFAAEPSPVHLEHVLHAAQARSLLRAPARGARLHPPDRPGLRRLWQRRNKGSHQAVEPAADESGDRQRDAAGVDGEHAAIRAGAHSARGPVRRLRRFGSGQRRHLADSLQIHRRGASSDPTAVAAGIRRGDHVPVARELASRAPLAQAAVWRAHRAPGGSRSVGQQRPPAVRAAGTAVRGAAGAQTLTRRCSR
mmetsp:Transcript_25216/g.72569  ORF Transcript_25216/g.72569 Transcript_25216/m.72569 type:complete len:311 (-) Transcript_25216:324-1256(-)